MTRPPTHGMRDSREYQAWINMRRRCEHQRAQNFADYGGRGIRVCARWRVSFQSFLADMGRCPDGMTLERNDNDGDYTPDNCRWATPLDQVRNRRVSVTLLAFGERKNLGEWAADARCAVCYRRLWSRVRSGWAPEAAVTTPAAPRAVAGGPAYRASVRRRITWGPA